MPLPKAPSQPADLLADYGEPAKPGKRHTRTATKRVARSRSTAVEPTPDTAKALDAAPQASIPLEKVEAPKTAKAAEPVKSVAPEAAEAALQTPAKRRRTTKAQKAATGAVEPTASTAAAKTPAKAPAKAPSTQAEKNAPKAEAKAEAKPEAKSAEKPAEKPAVKTTAKTTAKTAEKPAPAKKPRTRKAAASVAGKQGEMLDVTTALFGTPSFIQADAEVELPAEPVVAPVEKAAAAPVAAPASAPVRARRPASTRKGRVLMPEDKPKLFVLDTNVLMHDPLSLFRFAEHDVFLPMTTLEELDSHKKGLTDVARNARTVSRSLDALIEANNGNLHDGVPLALLGNTEAKGRLWFETKVMAAPLPEALPAFKGDNSILATVKGLEAAFPDRAVVLVSKDINMRIKATTLGIPAEDYFNDKVLDDSDMLYTGKIELEADFWESIGEGLRSWQENDATNYAFETDHPERFVVNACLTVKGDDNFMALVTGIKGREVTMRLMRDFRKSGRFKVWGINARNREQNMALNLLMDPEIDFVTILGQAGTGKTLMTLAAALTQTIDARRYSEIIMTRATVSLGEDIGFLPGTEEEKMAPWMGALEDNLEVLHKSDAGGEWGRQASMDIIRNRVRVKSMSFMRGRTFLQKFVIIDEAQNLSPKQMKTLITRAGPGTKIVCLGNIAQIDTPYLTEGSSGLTYVVERFQGWEHAATITLTRGERSRLAEFAAEAL